MEPIPVDVDAPDPALVAEAGRILRGGGIVAHPADTIYGLAAAARHRGALDRLRALKGRPEERPFIILVDEPGRLDQLVHSVRRYAVPWISRTWPGPLTLIFPARPDAPGAAADGSLAVRCPDQALTRALVREVSGVMASTSANRAGEPPLRDARAALACFGAGPGGLDLALERAPGAPGAPGDTNPQPAAATPSTIIDCRGEAPLVIRIGAIAPDELGIKV